MAQNVLEVWGVSADYLTQLVNENPSLRGMIVGYIAERKLREIFDRHARTSNHRKDDDHDRKKKGDLVVTYGGFEFRIEVKSLQTNSVEVLLPDENWMKVVQKMEIGRMPSPGFSKWGKPRKGKPIFSWVRNPEYEKLASEVRFQAAYRGNFQCDASDRRKLALEGGKTIETTLLRVGEFDIVAAGLFGFRGQWEFGFALNDELPRSTHDAYPETVRQQLIASLIPITLPLEPPFVEDPFVLLDRLVARRQSKTA